MPGERGPLPSANVRRRNKRPATGRSIPIERPTLPKTIVGEARAEWRRVVPLLESMGMLAKLDRGVLISYCRTWADWVEIDTALARSTKLVRGARNGDLIRNPLWRMRIEAEASLLELRRQLGLTPVARIRSGVKHEAPAVEEPGGTGPTILDAYRARLAASE